MKNVFVFSSIFLIATVVFLLVYNFVFRPTATTTTNVDVEPQEKPDVDPETLLPEVDRTKIGIIVPSSVQNIGYHAGTLTYRDTISTLLMEITERKSGKKPVIERWQREAPTNALWSPDTARAIISGGGEGIRVYDRAGDVEYPINADWVVWADDDRVLAKRFDAGTGKRYLDIMRYDGTEARTLAEVPFRRISMMAIPRSILVTYWPSPDAHVESELYAIGTISPGDPKLLHRGLYGADYLFSPDGQKIAVSSVTEKGGDQITLGVMDHLGNGYRNFQIPTLVTKVVWSHDGKMLYYAQPGDIPEGSTMPNDYVRGDFQTRDTFWSVEVETGKKQRLIALEEMPGQIDARELTLSDDGARIFFVNQADGFLYFLNLP